MAVDAFTGSNINAIDMEGDTPLHEAALWGSESLAKELILAGKKTSFSATVVHISAIQLNSAPQE